MSETTATPKGKDELTCFVVIGFGMKTDYATGRTLNLDLSYQKLIKPAFDRVGVRCFRAIDVNVTGSIDKLMYHWIYQADYVVADLSTMNANVFYELGVRHAQRPNTTLLMAEQELFARLPFDLSHTIIYGYEHLGEDIAEAEATRFVDLLAGQLEKLLAEPVEEDSPVYVYMPGMEAPRWKDPKEAIRELEEKLAEQTRRNEAGDTDPEAVRQGSLAMIVERAEAAKNAKDFATAIALFGAATENDEKDVFLWQRLALVTYKERERDEDDGRAIEALRAASRILEERCDLHVSTDPETLGLAGAINKRLYDRTGEARYFDASLHFYERGFYIKQDYYNGINAAYLYTIRAAEKADAGENYEAIVNYGHANLVRRKVAEICEALMASASFSSRGDREWIAQTLAQAHLGLGDREAAQALMPKIEALSKGAFDMDTFLKQNEDLLAAMATFEAKVEVPGPGAKPAAAPAAPVATRTIVPSPGEAISIDLGAHRDRPIRSVEIACKVEFE